MSPEKRIRKNTASARKLRSNLGSFSNGQWYCDCPESPEAEFHKAGKDTKNAGKWFWRCPKSRDAGCKFWLLEEEEELRKSRLVRMGLLDSPQLKTPSPNKRKRGEDPMSLVRGSGSRNVIEIKDEDSPASTLAHDDELEELYNATPSRKTAKTTTILTPRQTTREMAPEPTTPGSSSQTAVASRFQALDVFSTPSQFPREADSNKQTKSILAGAILDLLKSKNIELDDLTTLKIEHMIGLEIKQHEAVVSQCEMTIEKLSRRSEQWKSIVLQE
ncbi:hypothetical protein N431DRAFT_542703 [Stipitochalara longipes BDJ]|nr:hypothetical protein N431DRAFT_542703 [Stipitochalara longipes BDJ]